MSLGNVRCTSRTELLPVFIVELRGGAWPTRLKVGGKTSKPRPAFGVTLGSKVLEEAVGTARRAINVTAHAFDVILVAVSQRVNERIVRAAHRALARAHRSIEFRQCPLCDPQ
jgi:hypothetical protein